MKRNRKKNKNSIALNDGLKLFILKNYAKNYR